MSKDTFYFTHDYNARNDPKLLKVHKDMGLEGLGLYWCLVEMLYEQDGTLIMSDIDDYAFALRTDAKNIHDLIDNYKLFRKNQKYFYSDSINIRLKKRKEKSKKRQDAANARWSKDANALQTECNSNAIKESKGKEIKENNININNLEFLKSKNIDLKFKLAAGIGPEEYADLKGLYITALIGNDAAEKYLNKKIQDFDGWLADGNTSQNHHAKMITFVNNDIKEIRKPKGGYKNAGNRKDSGVNSSLSDYDLSKFKVN